MNINDYYIKYGTEGLSRLAKEAETTLSYLQRLIYDPKKRPSLDMSLKLVKASKNELTIEGLANPVKRIPKQLKSSRLG